MLDQLEVAHSNIPTDQRRSVILKDGSKKQFIDLQKNDIFQFIYDCQDTITHGTQPWFLCTKEPYINSDNIPTVGADIIQD
jgi:hypothetical protein